MPLTVIDISKLTAAIDKDYSNFTLARNNDHVIRVSVMKRDFHWHAHDNSDETFLVLEGEFMIGFDHHSESLKPGQLLTVPRGVRHQTRAKGRTVNLTFEHHDTSSAGSLGEA